MTTTTRPEFNASTDGFEVTRVFSNVVKGKTVLVTGVNRNGLGLGALREKYSDVEYHGLIIDLSSQKSVHDAASKVLSWPTVPKIDILINNAAIMNIPERKLSEEGSELHFATNHIGHFLFACMIMPKLIRAAENSPRGATRIVHITSPAIYTSQMRWNDLNFEQLGKDLPDTERPDYAMSRAFGIADPENTAYLPMEAYNQSKVANGLFGIAANRRLYEKYGILSLAALPGIVHTELMRYASPESLRAVGQMVSTGSYSMKSVGAAAATGLVAALDPNLGPGESKQGKHNYGCYLDDCQIVAHANPLAESSDEAEQLWALSESLVRKSFTW